MKVGDRVSMNDMWKYDYAVGEIDKITAQYTVVRWDGIPGYWHYTEEQAVKLQPIEDESENR